LLDFMPENTVVWIQDYAICRELLAENSGELQAFLEMQETWKALEEPGMHQKGKAKQMTTIEHKIKTTIEAIESVDDYTLFAVNAAIDSLTFLERLSYGEAKNKISFEINLTLSIRFPF